jgi:hypothetical protein
MSDPSGDTLQVSCELFSLFIFLQTSSTSKLKAGFQIKSLISWTLGFISNLVAVIATVILFL